MSRRYNTEALGGSNGGMELYTRSTCSSNECIFAMLTRHVVAVLLMHHAILRLTVTITQGPELQTSAVLQSSNDREPTN